MADYYTLLGVSKNASAEEIKRAYRNLARQYHPDINPSQVAAEHFKELTTAYTVLSDPGRRSRYDREGLLADPAELAKEVKQAFWEVVGEFFPGARDRALRRDGKTLKLQVTLSLEDTIVGTVREVSVPRLQRCQGCQGQGGTYRVPTQACFSCGGRGEVPTKQGIFTISRKCEQCLGRGSALESRCSDCLGRGERLLQTPLDLTFPPGLLHGQVITIRGAGFPGEGGGKNGDLDVEVQLETHPLFRPEGEDLWLEIPLRFDEVWLGTKLQVPTPDGEISLRVPPGTQPGSVLRVTGKGGFSAKHGRGNLMVRAVVETPQAADAQSTALAEALAALPHLQRTAYLERVARYKSQRGPTAVGNLEESD